MALLGGAGPAVVAGLCAFAALGYAIYQVSVLTLYVLSAPGQCTGKSHSFIRLILLKALLRADYLPSAALQRSSLSGGSKLDTCRYQLLMT